MSAQSVTVSGSVIDNQNLRKLDGVVVTCINEKTQQKSLTESDKEGKFSLLLEGNTTYLVSTDKQAFDDQTTTYRTSGSDDTQSLDLQLQRKPGYLFEATVKELITRSSSDNELGQELKNLKIEIYNNTTDKDIKLVEDNPKNTFEVNFERNNRYTIMIRKKGYFAKRIDVNVGVNGCVLCFEGLGNNYAPEIEAATTGSDRGTLIADIPMRKIVKDEAIKLDNIYYDYNKWNIRQDAKPALNNLVSVLQNNPVTIELGSHTDSRGDDAYNMTLSDKRAQSAVDYIISRGIKSARITAAGYGETIPINKCIDGVACTDAEYQANRRTEFKVTGFLEATNFDRKSLRQIIEAEKATQKRMKESVEGM